MAVEERNLAEIKVEGSQSVLFSRKEIETIRRTVAKGATEDEFRMFMHLARTYGLDPFNKEIWFIKYDKENPVIMTSRDGYLKIADRHPAYDGIVSDVVRKNDRFIRRIDGIEHEYGTDRGPIVGAYALVYRKDRKYPVYVFAPFEEYNAGTKVWNQYPSAMILKCAESMALKRAFTVSGLVSREEMEVQLSDGQNNDNTTIDIEPDDSNKSNRRELTPKEQEIKEIIGDNKGLKKDLYSYLEYVKEENKLDRVSIDDLTDEQYEELKMILNKIKRMITNNAQSQKSA